MDTKHNRNEREFCLQIEIFYFVLLCGELSNYYVEKCVISITNIIREREREENNHKFRHESSIFQNSLSLFLSRLSLVIL